MQAGRTRAPPNPGGAAPGTKGSNTQHVRWAGGQHTGPHTEHAGKRKRSHRTTERVKDRTPLQSCQRCYFLWKLVSPLGSVGLKTPSGTSLRGRSCPVSQVISCSRLWEPHRLQGQTTPQQRAQTMGHADSRTHHSAPSCPPGAGRRAGLSDPQSDWPQEHRANIQ